MLLDRTFLESLAETHHNEARVLSVYLHVDPRRAPYKKVLLELEDRLKALEGQVRDQRLLKAFRHEAQRVRAYLDQYLPAGRGLVIFASEPVEMWHVVNLPVPVPTLVHFDVGAYVRPLLRLVDEYERYAVAVVSSDRARLFLVFLGQIEEQGNVVHEDYVPRHKQGGWSAAQFQRHHDIHVTWHVKEVVQRLEQMLRQREFDRLLVGGAVEAVSRFLGHLPKPLQERLVGTFSVSAHASDREVLDQTMPLVEAVERQYERELVEALVTVAHKGPQDRGPQAVLGVVPTLDAVHRREAHQIVLAQGRVISGYECPQCRRLFLNWPPTCPDCGVDAIAVDDLLEHAAEAAVERGIRVEIVSGEAREALMQHEGAGAFLAFLPTGRRSSGTRTMRVPT